MTASAYVTKLRRMVAEPTTATYSDNELVTYIEANAVSDSEGRDPDNTSWEETYDLNRAAADIWDEKAAALSADAFDYTADGATLSRNQTLKNALELASSYRRKAKARSVKTVKSPPEVSENALSV